MNPPHRVRLHRLLLLIPLALLGAVLLVRARLPRPQTEGDKWLWEQAETVPSVTLKFKRGGRSMARQFGLDTTQTSSVKVEARQGIRALLRSLEGTPAFTPRHNLTDAGTLNLYRGSILVIDMGGDGSYDYLCLTRERSGYFLYHKNSRKPLHEVAPVSQHAFARLQGALRTAVSKAQHKQSGYSIYVAEP